MKASTILKGGLAALVAGVLLLITAGVLQAVGNPNSRTFAPAGGSFLGLGFLLVGVSFLRSGKAFSPSWRSSVRGLVDREHCPMLYYWYTGVYLVLGGILLFACARALLSSA